MLENGWMIVCLMVEVLMLMIGKNCVLLQWWWLCQGVDNEVMDSYNIDSFDVCCVGGKSGESDVGG